MTPVIHPCPFCGYTEGEAKETGRNEWSVCCGDCMANGPAWPTENGAVNLWNDRTPHDWHDDEGPTT